MTDSTRFETRLTDALGRYADRVPVDVDPERRRGHAGSRTSPATTAIRCSTAHGWPSPSPSWRPSRSPGLALFGGRLLAPVPPPVDLAEPDGAGPDLDPDDLGRADASSDRIARSVTGRGPAVDRGGHRRPARVTSIWRVGGLVRRRRTERHLHRRGACSRAIHPVRRRPHVGERPGPGPRHRGRDGDRRRRHPVDRRIARRRQPIQIAASGPRPTARPGNASRA